MKYTCAECGGQFETTWTDEEATAEAKGLFPDASPKDMGVVCDVCWRKIMGLLPSNPATEATE